MRVEVAFGGNHRRDTGTNIVATNDCGVPYFYLDNVGNRIILSGLENSDDQTDLPRTGALPFLLRRLRHKRSAKRNTRSQ